MVRKSQDSIVFVEHWRAILGWPMFSSLLIKILESLEHIEFIDNHFPFIREVSMFLGVPPTVLVLALGVGGIALIIWDRRKTRPHSTKAAKEESRKVMIYSIIGVAAVFLMSAAAQSYGLYQRQKCASSTLTRVHIMARVDIKKDACSKLDVTDSVLWALDTGIEERPPSK